MCLKILLSIMYTFLAATFCVGDLEQCVSPLFTPGGHYDINRQAILPTLKDLVLSKNNYYSDSVGIGGGGFYFMGLCLPGALRKLCSDCIQAVSNNLLVKCFNKSNSYEYGEDSSKGTVCLVRYNEIPFFETLVQYPVVFQCGAKSIGNVTEFESIWKDFMEDMIKAASTNANYAAKVSPPMGLQRIYSLMLCIPQMSSKNCEACLRLSVTKYKTACDGKLGTNIRRPSCFFKWEAFPFYHVFTDPKESTPPNSQAPQPASSPSDILPNDKKISTGIIVAIVVFAVIFAVLLTLGLVLLKKRLSYRRLNLESNDDHITSSQSLKFDFEKLEAATDEFSVNNKVGEGGFGEVYMGKLPNGTEIAVKRLSKNSGQGIQEFENEVALVAKLQHRNLVSLLGFCLEKDEQILVYEFVANKSLDYFLFDPTKQRQLDWRRRYNIIKGIIRGILYLHQDSRITIIHRDLKASNILLDADMNPKIADFGMARIFGVQQTRAHTSRIAGTYGYMAPEYVMEGQFSMKSDVYSFGVLVLEILSGKMNNSALVTEGSTGNFVKDAWRLWKNGSGLKLVDPTFGEDYQSDEVTRCIHIALLCVQQDPQDRPLMSTILSQLTSTSVNLELPRAPGLLQSSRDRDSEAEGSNSFGKPVPCSNTQIDPR